MKKIGIILIIAGILVLFSIGVFAYMYYGLGYGQDTFLTVHYYGADQKEIFLSKGLSVVGGLGGVEYISFDINVDNTGEVPLELRIDEASPFQLDSAVPTTTLTLAVGESDKWTSSLIDVSPFEGKTQIFSVLVKGTYTYAGRTYTLNKEGSISLSIQPDPLGGFDVNVILTGGSDDDDVDPTCTESWTCGEWGICTNNQQMRECVDANSCGTTTNMPDIVRGCSDKTVIFRTEDDRLGSTDWIMYQGIGYGRYGSSSSTRVISGCETNILDLEIMSSGRYLGMANGEELKVCFNGGKSVTKFKISDPNALEAVLTDH